MRKLLLVVGLVVALAPVGCGNSLNEDTILSPSYYARHAKKFLDDCHQFRIDIDRSIFGLEDVPIEMW